MIGAVLVGGNQGWVQTAGRGFLHYLWRFLLSQIAATVGCFAAELALLEPKTKYGVLRAGKILQSSNRVGGNLQLLVQSADDVRETFNRHSIRYVVQMDTPLHHNLAAGSVLAEALRDVPVRRKFEDVRVNELNLP